MVGGYAVYSGEVKRSHLVVDPAVVDAEQGQLSCVGGLDAASHLEERVGVARFSHLAVDIRDWRFVEVAANDDWGIYLRQFFQNDIHLLVTATEAVFQFANHRHS